MPSLSVNYEHYLLRWVAVEPEQKNDFERYDRQVTERSLLQMIDGEQVSKCKAKHEIQFLLDVTLFLCIILSYLAAEKKPIGFLYPNCGVCGIWLTPILVKVKFLRWKAVDCCWFLESIPNKILMDYTIHRCIVGKKSLITGWLA